ncbi:recombinase family protein [Streptomyces zhihengii]
MTPPRTLPATFQGSSSATEGEPWLGYIRVSTYYEDKISPDIQRAAIEAWAKRTGRRIVAWIEDLDVSGRTFRRKISGAFKAVEEREVRGIAVWRYSRFGRSRHGNALNLYRLEQLGGRLESATEAADTSTAFGRLQMGMAFKFAEFESERIGEQWAETRENRLARGLPATGGQRWGYVWTRRRLDEENALHPETYTPDDRLGLTVTDLYERIANGEKMNSLCLWLGRNGYVSTRGTPWRQTGLTRYLDSGFPAGYIRTHPTDCDCPPADPDGPSHRAALCTRRIWLPGAQEVIVPDSVWEEYQRRRKEAASAPRKSAPSYPTSWLVQCARCGGSASIGGGSTVGAGGVRIRKNGYVFRCSERKDSGTCAGVYILRTVVEDTVKDRLREWADEIESETATIPRQTGHDRAETAGDRLERARTVLTDQLADIEQQLDRQTGLLTRGIIPEDSYVRERDRLLAEQAAVTAQLAELAAEAEQPAAVDRAALAPVMRGLVTRWDTTPADVLRALLREVLHGIWAYPRRTLPDGTEAPAYAVPVPLWEPRPKSIGRQAWTDAQVTSESR